MSDLKILATIFLSIVPTSLISSIFLVTIMPEWMVLVSCALIFMFFFKLISKFFEKGEELNQSEAMQFVNKYLEVLNHGVVTAKELVFDADAYIEDEFRRNFPNKSINGDQSKAIIKLSIYLHNKSKGKETKGLETAPDEFNKAFKPELKLMKVEKGMSKEQIKSNLEGNSSQQLTLSWCAPRS